MLSGFEPSPNFKKESGYEELPDLKGQDLLPNTVMIEEDYFKSDPLLKQEE